LKELITQRLKLKDVLPQHVNRIAGLMKKENNEVSFIRKGIGAGETRVDPDERTITSYITTKAKDRDNEIVLPSGAILDDYRKHPVVLFGHNYEELPVGKNLWIKTDEKGLIAKTQYATHKKADEIYEYRKNNYPLAESIGFVPISSIQSGKNGFNDDVIKKLGLTKEEVDGVHTIYDKWLMLEYSDVPVPSNPEALQIAINKGLVHCANYANCARREERMVIPYRRFSMAPLEEEWDAVEEVRKASVINLRVMCTWFDKENYENKTAYKLPHHKASGYSTVWRGVAAAMTAILGGRGGVDIPDNDKREVYDHLAKHYKEFDKPVPDFSIKEKEDEEPVYSGDSGENETAVPKESIEEDSGKLTEALSEVRKTSKKILEVCMKTFDLLSNKEESELKETEEIVEEDSDDYSEDGRKEVIFEIEEECRLTKGREEDIINRTVKETVKVFQELIKDSSFLEIDKAVESSIKRIQGRMR
jgi:hypothetical protein